MTNVENSPLSAGSRSRESIQDDSERQLLQAVLEKLGIQSSWDLLIVGDGSGSGWGGACGWASVVIDRNNLVARGQRGRRLFYGAMEAGSINLAESMPYLQAIAWYDGVYGKDLLRNRGFLDVHILTDSQTVAHWGVQATAGGGEPPRKGLAVWSIMREYSRVGYRFHMHWAERITTELNWASDLIAGLCRREIMEALHRAPETDVASKAAEALGRLQFIHPLTGHHVDVYSHNPDFLQES